MSVGWSEEYADDCDQSITLEELKKILKKFSVY